MICFMLAFLAGAYRGTGTMMLIESYSELDETDTALQSNMQNAGESNLEIVENTISEVAGEDLQRKQTAENKYNRGVFSTIFNNATKSGSFVFGLLSSFNQWLFHGRIVSGLITLIGTLITVLYWFLISNSLRVSESRFFMEATLYQKTSLRKLLFPIQIRRWRRISVVMFFKFLYHTLWYLTIIGGIIKGYSYKMVPYIVAENPNVTRKEAIALSRRMMNGYKWRAFLLDVSFWGWNLLGLMTLGILSILYVNPYKKATETQLYFAVREQAIQNRIEGYQLLNDQYLVKQPVAAAGQAVPLSVYPMKLFTIPEQESRKWIQVDYRRNYTIWLLILLFIIFSVVGWLWEVSLHLTKEGFVNRGVLQGPWLPIYGSGGVLVLVLLKKVRKNPMLTFILTVTICGILEYFTSWYLETFKGHKWWDYSGYFLNLDGRICAEGLLVFGLGGCVFIYLFAPLLDDLIQKIPRRTQILLCVVLMSLFITDEVYSSKHPNTGKGVTSYSSIPMPEKLNSREVMCRRVT